MKNNFLYFLYLLIINYFLISATLSAEIFNFDVTEVKILEEGMAIRASDIDIIWINGYGWPVYEGGPMFYGNLIGFDKILDWLKKMEEEHGSDFAPSPYLEKVVNEKLNIFS